MAKWSEEQRVEAMTIAHASGAAEAAKVTGIAAGVAAAAMRATTARAARSGPAKPTRGSGGSPRASRPPEGRDAAGRFLPGVSGNPSGRSGCIIEARRLAEGFSPESIRRLWAIIEDSATLASVRLGAISELLDRGMGKPRQAVEVIGEVMQRYEYHITEQIIQRQPDLLDRVFSQDIRPSLEDRRGQERIRSVGRVTWILASPGRPT